MSVFNFELLKVPFASGAVLSEIAPFPDYVRGLGIAFEQTDGKPEMKGLNGLFNAITTSMLSLRQRGISEWVTGFDYPVGAFSVESGKLYQAKRLNTSKQPSASQSDWTLWASVSDITVHSNGNIKKTNLPNGAFELKVEDANTTTKGAARFATATEVANKANVMAAVTPANVAAMIEQFPTIKASVKSGSAGGVFGGIGFSSVVRLGTGYFEFTLSSPAPSTNYIVMLTSSWGGRSGAASVSLDPDFAQTTTKFRAVCYWGGDNTNGSFDPVTLNAIVIY